jgi:TPR repeat protein
MSKSLGAAVLLAALAAAGCTERQPGGVALDMSYCQSVPASALETLGCPRPARTASDIDRGRYDLQLAEMYLDGTGVPRDEAKAFYLASDASVAGNVDAKELLGRMYAEGRGVPRDDELATNLFRAAVDAGNVAALNDLGQMVEAGRGTPAAPEEALDYYERGMDANDPKARQNYQRLKKSLEAPKPKETTPATNPQIVTQALPPPA